MRGYGALSQAVSASVQWVARGWRLSRYSRRAAAGRQDVCGGQQLV